MDILIHNRGTTYSLGKIEAIIKKRQCYSTVTIFDISEFFYKQEFKAVHIYVQQISIKLDKREHSF